MSAPQPVASFDYERHGLIASPRRVEIPGGPQTVARLLDESLAERPDTEALVGRHRRYTFAELDREVNQAANALASLGIGPFDRVAACLANHTEIVVAYLATMRLGAIWVGVNRPLAAPEKAYVLRDAQVGVLLAEPETVEQVAPLVADLPHLRHLLDAGPGDDASDWARLVAGASSDGPPPGIDEIDPWAPAAIAYTSGTTGFPKGAVHSQHNMLMPGRIAKATGRYVEGDVLGVYLPFTILNLLCLGPALGWQNDKAVVCIDRSDALGIAEWIRDERVTTFSAVPATIFDLLTNPAVTDDHLASLIRPGVGGADLPDAFRVLYRERFNAEVMIGYGLTEAPTAVTYTDPFAEPVAGSCGAALPHVDITIVDDADRPVAAGESGELCVGPVHSGPWAGVYSTFLGYWNRPDATAEALRGGILHTNDVAMIDAAGNVFIRDRKGDVIIRGGANVYPAEVERVIHDDPRVAACAVVGRPDERLGERVVAFVQPFPEHAPDAAAPLREHDLRAHCTANLARYKVPEEWHFVDSFPRNAMNKIKKTELRARLDGMT
jgi:long-chain acyl-CoA synthetase